MSFHIRRLKEEAPPSRFSQTVTWFRRLRLPTMLIFRYIRTFVRTKKLQQQRRILLRKLLIGCIIVMLSVAGMTLGVKALIHTKVLTVPKLMDAAGTPLPTDEHGYTNFLLLGQGDEGHDGVDLTDTLILASIDPKTKSAAMISIPRDLYVRTKNMGAGRINALYRDFKGFLMQRENIGKNDAEHMAMKELATELSGTFGIELHHVIKVDFIGFVQAVDALGGLDIQVPEDLYDPEYPDNNYGYQLFSVLAGPQHFDGETALKYARSRHSTSDFDRSRRQQDIIQALADTAKKDGSLTDPTRITSLLRIMDEHVATTLTFREMVTLATLATTIDRSKILSVQFNLEGPGGFLYPPPRDQFGGASVLIPNSWDEIRTFMKLMLIDRPLFLDSGPIDVFNAGAPSGGAGMLGIELERYTLQIDTIKNYDGEDRPTSAIFTPKFREKTARSLGSLLHITDIAVLPDTATGTTIQILLGKDYRYASINDLSTHPNAEQ